MYTLFLIAATVAISITATLSNDNFCNDSCFANCTSQYSAVSNLTGFCTTLHSNSCVCIEEFEMRESSELMKRLKDFYVNLGKPQIQPCDLVCGVEKDRKLQSSMDSIIIIGYNGLIDKIYWYCECIMVYTNKTHPISFTNLEIIDYVKSHRFVVKP